MYVLLLLLSTLSLTAAESDLTDPIKTDKGPVRGQLLTTIENSIKYSAFKGIPYGKPPIGYLRFKAPIEPEKWTETLNATSEPNKCIQEDVNGTIGSEDCLYLNVYTPKTTFNSGGFDQLLAVMVWIYGGGFVSGSIDADEIGPDFLIEDNVVVVAMNYRLGTLGFLSLNHTNATGNAGLKDQVLALKWVKKNIKNFGGDPNNVTIFGQSAGAVSVELHKISELSSGLFHRSIAMSGAPLNPWSFWSLPEAVDRAYVIGIILGFNISDKDKLLEKFYQADAHELSLAGIKDAFKIGDLPFKPTYENKQIAGNEAFLSECPLQIYKSRKFPQLPHIMGFVKTETLGLTSSFETFQFVVQASLTLASKLSLFDLPVIDDFNEVLGSSITDINDFSDDLLHRVFNGTSDFLFVTGIDQTQQYLANGSAPIYYYRNSFFYNGSAHQLRGIKLNDIGHGDDFYQIFWSKNASQSSDPNSDIGIQRRKMVRMWTNFAKYANPTPSDIQDDLLDVTWTPSGIQGNHLEISNDKYEMQERPIDDDVRKIEEASKDLEKSVTECLSIGLSNKTDVVQTDKGPIRGEIFSTISKRIQYSAFAGIPYGKPPRGHLRFQAPVEVHNWTGIMDSRPDLQGCPQFRDEYMGDEDCLYLNVYTPKVQFKSVENHSRAVIVWVHGGSFIDGSADHRYYGPDFFIEEDIILVYINYRLGAFGFLTLNHPNATGNAGLKDQVLALKWIQKNIKKFGGDPNKVTLLGQSAGSVAVELHAISPMSKGLFSRSIGMSGSPLNFWGFSPNMVAQARGLTLAIQLGTTSFDPNDVLEKLYNASAKEIVLATQKMTQLDLPFKPTLEDVAVSKEPFLSECAFKAYETGEFDRPHILGYCRSETITYVPKIFTTKEQKRAGDQLMNRTNSLALEEQSTGIISLPTINWTEYFTWLLSPFDIFIRFIGILTAGIREFLLTQGVETSTDLLFILGIDQTQQYRSKGSAPVWYYQNTFNYNSSVHKMDGFYVDGAAHGDDVAEIFWMSNRNQSLATNSDIAILRTRIVRMWSNFAKYADPTPNGTADALLNITWPPSGTEGKHLEISRTLELGDRPIDWIVKTAEFFAGPIEELLNGCYSRRNGDS